MSNKPNFTLILALICTLAAVGQITNTIYVPGMAEMARYFHVQPRLIQMVMTAYLLPYGLSQFLYGPLSDHFGRRPMILSGLAIFSLGSLIACLSHSFAWLLLGSLVQGLGAGTGGVMARTVPRDLYQRHDLQKANSAISMCLILAPLLAPVLGGSLTSLFGWRANFICLLCFGACVLAFQWLYFSETKPNHAATSLSLRNILKNYLKILRNPQFSAYMLCLLVSFSGIAVFEASSGLIFGDVLGFSPFWVSILFIIPLPVYILGSFIANRLSGVYSCAQLTLSGILLLCVSSLILLGFAILGHCNITVILLPICVYLFAVGIIFPSATTGAIEPFALMAGSAGALLGGIQNLGASMATLLSSHFEQTSQLPLAYILAGSSLGLLAIYLPLQKFSVKNQSLACAEHSPASALET